MRVQYTGEGGPAIVEALRVEYVEDLFCDNESFPGLLILGLNNTEIGISNISIEEAHKAIEQLLQYGFVDLKRYNVEFCP